MRNVETPDAVTPAEFPPGRLALFCGNVLVQLAAPVFGFAAIVLALDPARSVLETLRESMFYGKGIWKQSSETILIAIFLSFVVLFRVKSNISAIRFWTFIALANALVGGWFAIGRSM